MIAWVAARNDGPNYGEVVAYRFPADTTIFGPAQIEARIDQDPEISAQISLWNQSGSQVIRGNLIVVPVGESLLYLQPVYLQSTSSAFPEFQKIVVASPTTVVWGDTLAEALTALLEQAGRRDGRPAPRRRPARPPRRPRRPPPGPPTGDARARRRAARPTSTAWSTTPTRTSSWPRRRCATGDFATYGDEMDKVQARARAPRRADRHRRRRPHP